MDVTRAAWIAVVLMAWAWAGAADARIPEAIAQEPARPRGTSEDLRVSQFPARTTAGGLRYDLYCPHTTDANPLVVVALDAGETLEHAEPLAHHFAKSGLIVVVVEPAPDGASYPSRIGQHLGNAGGGDGAIQPALEGGELGARLDARGLGWARPELAALEYAAQVGARRDQLTLVDELLSGLRAELQQGLQDALAARLDLGIFLRAEPLEQLIVRRRRHGNVL